MSIVLLFFASYQIRTFFYTNDCLKISYLNLLYVAIDFKNRIKKPLNSFLITWNTCQFQSSICRLCRIKFISKRIGIGIFFPGLKFVPIIKNFKDGLWNFRICILNFRFQKPWVINKILKQLDTSGLNSTKIKDYISKIKLV